LTNKSGNRVKNIVMENKLYKVRIELRIRNQVATYPDLYVSAVSKDEAERKAWDYGNKNSGEFYHVDHTIFISEISEPFIP